MLQKRIGFTAVGLLLAVSATAKVAADGPRLGRLIWQDDDAAAVRWGDIRWTGSGYDCPPQEVEGFPQLDQEQQSLVQMRAVDNLIFLGVRSQPDGEATNGWLAIESGVGWEDHGDHGHVRYEETPRVRRQELDRDQGNPAHVYLYDGQIALANDAKNGFTVVDPRLIRKSKPNEPVAVFYEGGHQHITLAIAARRVAYATWIDAEGDAAGRIDCVGIGELAGKRYHFHGPSGRLHGATVCQGKAFFAPAEGVCWVPIDLDVDDDPQTIDPKVISLGTDSADQPLRTGAFVTAGTYVLCTAGSGPDARLCLIDAAAASPQATSIDLPVDEGTRLTSPITLSTAQGPMAVLFSESADAPEDDALHMIQLDPNRDGDFSDATLRDPLPVGKNRIVGHSGHHDAAIMPDGKTLAVTNPGDGSIQLISMLSGKPRGTLEVGGTPTRLVVEGHAR